MKLTCPSCETAFVVETEQLGPGGRQVRCGSCGHSWHQDAENEAPESGAPENAAAENGAEKSASPAPESPPEAESPGAESPGAESPGAESPAAESPAAESPAAESPAAESPAAESTAAESPKAESPKAESPEKPEKRPRRRRPKPTRQKEAHSGRASLFLGWFLFVAVIGGLAAGMYFGRTQVLALVPAAAPLYQLAGLMPPPAGVPLELRDVKTARRVVEGEQVVVVEGVVSNTTGEPQSVPLLRASLIDAKGDEVESWTFAASATTLPPGETTGFETIAKNPPREGRILIDFVVTP